LLIAKDLLHNASLNAIVIPNIAELLDKIQKQTYDSGSLATVFDSKLWCTVDVFVVSNSYGTILLVKNRQKILAVEAVNTTQSTDITTIQGVNTTQTVNIATNTAITNKFTIIGTTLEVNSSSTQFRLRQDLNMYGKYIKIIKSANFASTNGGVINAGEYMTIEIVDKVAYFRQKADLTTGGIFSFQTTKSTIFSK
jgi:predicted outer membrane repeat protein